VFDPVGGAHAEPAFRSIAWRGRYLVIGFADGRIPALPWNLPLLKGASLVGVFWGDFVRREPEANARMLGALASQYAHSHIKPVIDRVIPLSRLAEAYARLENRQVLGKVVMVPDALLKD
jgi:NADPH2:quinone reductase